MSRPGFFFLICPDSELIQEQIAALAAAHPPDPEQTYERRIHWGDDGLTSLFWEDLTLTGLFARPKLLVVRQAQFLDAAAWDSLASVLRRFIPHAWPLFCLEVAFDRGKPSLPKALAKQKYYGFAQDKGWIWQSPGLTEQGLKDWLRSWAAAHGLRFGPGGLEALAAILPTDAAAASREMEKIELACAPGAAIGPEAAGLVSHAAELDIFAFIDALQRGSTPVKIWQTVFLSGQTEEAPVFRFLAMFLREARILWQIHFGEFTGRLPPSVLQAKEALSRRLGPGRIARIFDLAMETELGVKTGERTAEQALELFVAEISKLLGPSAHRQQGIPAPPHGRELRQQGKT